MIRINQINCKAEAQISEKQLQKKAAETLKLRPEDILSLKIVRRSIDARHKPDIFYSYVLDVTVKQEEKVLKRSKAKQASIVKPVKYIFPQGSPFLEDPQGEPLRKESNRPVIIGTGPAGLFCGYYLAKARLRPILLERGKDVDSRTKDVEQFWQKGVLLPGSNVQFGEGGAGTFSDGKLNTLIKDKDGRGHAVLETFVRFGAPESILYDAKPHIGTDVLRRVVKGMRKEIEALGGEVRFRSQVTDFHLEKGRIAGVVINEKEVLPCSQVVLAIGHSARDTFEKLYEHGADMEAKAFAVGLRVEHPQSMINLSQYGMEDAGFLGAAPYKVTAQTSVGRGVYSFCMCPGGYVVNASSEPGRLAVNGMSYSGRDGRNANSAIIVAVTPKDFGSDHPLAGVAFQRRLEEKAYELGQGRIPVQRYGDFKDRVLGSMGQQTDMAEYSDSPLTPQNKGAWVYADVSQILPPECNQAFVEGMTHFGKLIPGFDRQDALLSGVESRTSSPLRIMRDEGLESNIKGLYPCGEGAGYAGGITSAAMDGLRVAEKIFEATQSVVLSPIDV